MSRISRVWTLRSRDRLLVHLMMLSSHSTRGGWLCHRAALGFHSSSSSVRHQTVAAAPGTRCSSTRPVLCSRCRTGDTQHRSDPAPGGQGPAAPGQTVHVEGPRGAGRVKPHTSLFITFILFSFCYLCVGFYLFIFFKTKKGMSFTAAFIS